MGSGEIGQFPDRSRVSAYSSACRMIEITNTCTHGIRRNGNDHKLLKISYIISRRTSIDIFKGKSSDIAEFAEGLISKLAGGNVLEALGSLTGTILKKLIGASSGSAQTEKI